MLNKDIKNAALYLALITASLYVFGLFLNMGMLEFWGLSAGLFPLSFEEHVFLGILSPLTHITTWAKYFAWASIPLLILVIMARFIYTKIKDKSWFTLITKSFDRSDDSPFEKLLFSSCFIVGKYLLIVFGSISLFFYIATASIPIGKEIAEKSYDKIQNGQTQPITLKIKSNPEINAYRILCSNSHCAFLVDNTVTTYPMADIAYIKNKLD